MVKLMREADSSESASTALSWADLNYLRHGFAWLAALEALTVLLQHLAL